MIQYSIGGNTLGIILLVEINGHMSSDPKIMEPWMCINSERRINSGYEEK